MATAAETATRTWRALPCIDTLLLPTKPAGRTGSGF
jgi:hypothetical protein